MARFPPPPTTPCFGRQQSFLPFGTVDGDLLQPDIRDDWEMQQRRLAQLLSEMTPPDPEARRSPYRGELEGVLARRR